MRGDMVEEVMLVDDLEGLLREIEGIKLTIELTNYPY